jgi:hypothetical protein
MAEIEREIKIKQPGNTNSDASIPFSVTIIRTQSQNQRLKSLSKIVTVFWLFRALPGAFYPLCSGKPAFMFDLKPHPQPPRGQFFVKRTNCPLAQHLKTCG